MTIRDDDLARAEAGARAHNYCGGMGGCVECGEVLALVAEVRRLRAQLDASIDGRDKWEALFGEANVEIHRLRVEIDEAPHAEECMVLTTPCECESGWPKHAGDYCSRCGRERDKQPPNRACSCWKSRA